MKMLVTGGGGFLGGAVVDALLARGDEVTSFARGEYPELQKRGVRVVQGDLADGGEILSRAMADCDTVFHVAAKAGIWGPRSEYERSNVAATEQVLLACRQSGITKLVYTSTPSVVHAGGDIQGGNESLPYSNHGGHYPQTKAAAERLVLAANGPELSTVALRPHLMWGPGDTQLVPRILSRARAGRLRFPGNGESLIDSTYISDAAGAHLAASDALGVGAPCAGKAYFITQGEPRSVKALVNGILGAAGLKPEERTIPLPVAVGAGYLCEALWHLFRRSDEPPMTPFLARQLATAHWFDISAAQRDLSWAPKLSLDEGLVLLAASLQG